eukprot:767241-Hanusia_phi.AAC.4
MLNQDAAQRLSAAQVLEHAWIKSDGQVEGGGSGLHANHTAFLLLRKTPVFANVEPTCLREITNRLIRVVMEPGQYWQLHEDTNLSMCFIETGKLELIVDGIVVDRLTTGEYFGEAAVLVGRQLSIDAYVPKSDAGLPFPTTLFKLKGTDFLELIKSHPKLEEHLAQSAIKRLREETLRKLDVLPGSAQGRYAIYEALEALEKKWGKQSEQGQSLLRRDGGQEDWKKVWRVYTLVIICVLRIHRLSKRPWPSNGTKLEIVHEDSELEEVDTFRFERRFSNGNGRSSLGSPKPRISFHNIYSPERVRAAFSGARTARALGSSDSASFSDLVSPHRVRVEDVAGKEEGEERGKGIGGRRGGRG